MILKTLYSAAPLAGALWSLMPIVYLSYIAIGAMIVPNMIALLFMSKEVKSDLDEFFEDRKRAKSASSCS